MDPSMLVTESSAEPAELKVPANGAFLELIAQFVGFMARQAGFDERDVARMRLAVDEACANALVHGGLGGGGAPLRVVCESWPDRLVIRVEDRGSHFDLATVPEPRLDTPLEKRKVGGLGVHLMRRIMDQVEVLPHPDGKELVMTKYLPREEASGDGG